MGRSQSPAPELNSVISAPAAARGIRIRSLVALAIPLICSVITGCGDGGSVGSAPPPKTVEVIELQSGVPRSETRVAGVVEPYRRSDLSFDVSGILEQVLDIGVTADGPQFDGQGALLLRADGTPVRAGDVVAMLDPTRFKQALTAAELSLASTDRQIDALRLELSEVFPARVANAEANAAAATANVTSARESVAVSEAELDLAETTVERDRVLIRTGAVAQSVLDESESAFRTAVASLAQARSGLDSALQSEQSTLASLSETRGDFRVRQADLESLRATRAELVNAVEQAQTDLDACILRAPFRGRITRRHAERGGYINAGSAVAELTMETAVKIAITLSADQERRVGIGEQLPVYVDDPDQPGQQKAYMATVFEKSSVADTGTRTFRVGLILPNPLLDDLNDTERTILTGIGGVFPVLALPETGSPELFVNTRAVLEDNGETFVFALPALIDSVADASEIQVPERIKIRLVDRWQQLDTWTLRGIEPVQGLTQGTPTVLDPDQTTQQGVRVGSLQFAFRPGDIVRVGVDADLPERGFWLPDSAIVSRTGKTFVYAIDTASAREIGVEVREASGHFRRVSAPELEDGQRIASRGVQYLQDGDAVQAKPAASEVGQ